LDRVHEVLVDVFVEGVQTPFEAALTLQPFVDLRDAFGGIVDNFHRMEFVVAVHAGAHAGWVGGTVAADHDGVVVRFLGFVVNVDDLAGVELVLGVLGLHVVTLDFSAFDDGADVIDVLHVPLDKVCDGECNRVGFGHGCDVASVHHQHKHVDFPLIAQEVVFQELQPCQVAWTLESSVITQIMFFGVSFQILH